MEGFRFNVVDMLKPRQPAEALVKSESSVTGVRLDQKARFPVGLRKIDFADFVRDAYCLVVIDAFVSNQARIQQSRQRFGGADRVYFV